MRFFLAARKAVGRAANDTSGVLGQARVKRVKTRETCETQARVHNGVTFFPTLVKKKELCSLMQPSQSVILQTRFCW